MPTRWVPVPSAAEADSGHATATLIVCPLLPVAPPAIPTIWQTQRFVPDAILTFQHRANGRSVMPLLLASSTLLVVWSQAHLLPIHALPLVVGATFTQNRSATAAAALQIQPWESWVRLY